MSLEYSGGKKTARRQLWKRVGFYAVAALPAVLFICVYYSRAERRSWLPWTLDMGSGVVGFVRFSPDSKTLQVAGQRVEDYDFVPGVGMYLWDIKTRKLLRSWLLPEDNESSDRIYSPDGKVASISGKNNSLQLWDTRTGRLLHQWKADSQAWPLVFSPDGIMLASESEHLIELWSVRTGERLRTLRLSGMVNSALFSPDGSFLVGRSSTKVKWWSMPDGKLLHTITQPTTAMGLAISPDSRTIAIGDDARIALWDWRTGKPLRTLPNSGAMGGALSFAPDGKMLAGGGVAGKVRLWDVQTGTLIRTLAAHRDNVSGVAFSLDGNWLVTEGKQQTESTVQTVKLWRVK